MNNYLISDKTFYKEFLTLAFSLILEQVIILSVNLIDNLMIGNYSETALSGVAAVNQIQFFIQSVALAIGNGLVVLVSQYMGRKQTALIGKLTAVGLLHEIVFTVLIMLPTCLLPEACVKLFVDSESAIAEGVQYLKIIRYSYPFFMITTVMLAVLRSVGTTKVPIVVSGVSLCINAVINYFLIAGNMGAPELGVRGAAVGTVSARIVECAIVIVYIIKHEKMVNIRFSDMIKPDGNLVWEFAITSMPIIIQGALWGLANEFQSAVLGHLSSQAIAAYSISSTVFLLLKVASVGSCTAAAMLIGRLVGAGETGIKLRQTTRTLQILFCAIGTVLCITLLALRAPLLSVYQISDITYQLASDFILIQSVVLFTMSYQMPTNAGIIRGGGDTRFGMVLDAISIWGIVVPVSFFAAFVWRWPVTVVVMCLNSDQIFKCIPAFLYVNNYKWIHNLTQDRS